MQVNLVLYLLVFIQCFKMFDAYSSVRSACVSINVIMIAALCVHRLLMQVTKADRGSTSAE